MLPSHLVSSQILNPACTLLHCPSCCTITTQHNIYLLVPGTVELRCFTGRTAPTCRLSSRPYSSHHAISQHLIGSRGLRVPSLPGILFLLHIAEHPWLVKRARLSPIHLDNNPSETHRNVKLTARNQWNQHSKYWLRIMHSVVTYFLCGNKSTCIYFLFYYLY